MLSATASIKKTSVTWGEGTISQAGIVDMRFRIANRHFLLAIVFHT